ncbi:MAG: NUDIX hydrolase [Patescibacteria group bacterium]
MDAKTDKKEWVDWLNTKVLQKAVLVDGEGNLLAIRRVPDGPASRKDKWDLPGGSLSPEDLEGGVGVAERAITREVLEETGLEIESANPVHVTSWTFQKSVGTVLGVAIGYRCSVSGIKPAVTLSDEHYEYQWVSKEDLLNLDFGDDGGLHKDIARKA